MATYYLDENGKVSKKKKKNETESSSNGNGRTFVLKDNGTATEKISVFSTKDDEIAPVRETTQDKKQKWYEGWLDKGAFDDGYQFGDYTKTVVSSAADLKTNFGGGLLEIGEGAVDTLAYDEAKPLYNYAQDLSDELNRNKGEAGLIEYAKDDTKLMQLYLLESGKGKVEDVVKETRTELSQGETEQYDYLINSLGEDVINSIKAPEGSNPLKHRVKFWEQNGEKITEAYKKLLSEEYGFTDEQVANVIEQQKTGDYLKMIMSAYRYLHNGATTVKTEKDFKATQEAIREAVKDTDYKQWVENLFKGSEEKSGIRNNVGYFTPMGNRRSFEATHWENNLENVVRAMKSEVETGGGALISGLGIYGVSAKKYKSIDEIKADSDRLTHISEDEYKEIKRSFGERLGEIANSIMDKTESNPFIANDNACEGIVDAIRNSKTKSGILKNLKQYRQLNVTETTVDDIVSLVSDIANMPTEYFDAVKRPLLW